jgi:hypothetical protein
MTPGGKVLAAIPLRLASASLAHHLPTDKSQMPPELAAVVNAWPELPEAVRAGIVAMVKAASSKPGGR